MKKKKSLQTTLKLGYRIKWKRTRNLYDNKDPRLTGEIDIWDFTEDDARHQFLASNNICGLKFKILSVTEIQGSDIKTKKAKPNINKEHEHYDDYEGVPI